MGSSKKDKDVKKLTEQIKTLMQTNAEAKKQLEAQGLKIETLESQISEMSPDEYKHVNENYEEFKKKYQYQPNIPVPPTIPPVEPPTEPPTQPPTEPPVTPPPTTGGGEQKDANGINKIYADKAGGVFIPSDKFSESEFTRNYASGKPSENSYECEYKDSNKLENEEVTFYTQINGFKKEPDTLSIKLLGNKHSDGSKDKWLIYQIDTDGKKDDNFQIEDPHPTNHDNHQPVLFEIGGPIIGKPIGVKAITFIAADGKRHAETWLDFPTTLESPSNKWRKYIDIKDVGSLSHGFVNATNGGALLRIDGTKKGSLPTTKFMSIREIVPQLSTTGPVIPPVTPSTEPPVVVVPPVVPPVTPPSPMQGALDEDGIMIPFKRTGNSVPLTEGNDHPNGQRYSINHKFQNYYMVGYFKLGKGQEQIEMKTDGPNHGSCTKLPECCWVEADLAVADRTNQEGMKFKPGQSFISSEWPHPVNHSPPKDQNMPIVPGIKPEQWLGFSVCAYQDGEFRHIEMRVDIDPFDASGKPQNKWQMGVNEIDKGQITNAELCKRKMAVDFDQGLEAEIRMHKAVNHDCQIKFAKVYEIIPPV